MTRGIAILGSTGSVGTQALDVIDHHPGRFRVVALAAGRQVERLAEQARRYRPALLSVADAEAAAALRQRLQSESGGYRPEITWGQEGLIRAATHPESSLVLTSVVGAMGVEPTLAAIEAGKDIALANKETLVAAGELVMAAARARGVKLLPVDSEHSAIFQSLSGADPGQVRRILLTASGGPFRGRKDLSGVTREEALRHPRWSMGAKITIDSATLMNKALEMIEARWLFGVPMERIEVIIHPESILHSAVEFVDGNVIAQLGPTDMRLPIQYALCYPERCPGFVQPLDLIALGSLTFERPDEETFPSLCYARRAATMGGTMPAVLNAANEVAVERFLAGEIPFTGIFQVVAGVMDRHDPVQRPDLAAILAADRWARAAAREQGITG
ncbi:1-deoxy-D-xylulose-5-phosphate reductoisomerase [Symbiobacterium thermophilum]|uniref:1-deoxy-D-xylulose 5-phosphate reductoisomerase n=1 Tax=Symbiobacterium thermophilum TaxID=2734 RepID=A0A953IF80_SYMTR|nr:1-deoxy-D-xylulose-5-phosphate reductoisomerase [Symbiobacterium thermophilum]MBY6278259.1 1-deoxy-D-xylulose-5-phosphate reductoisomerase [Symbiobacterium thermophilum]